MWLEAYYTVNEYDAPYKASTSEDMCKAYKNAKKAASVEETYYVGGGYGQMTEKSLMKEIMARGPVLYDFNAGYEFMTYKNGILMSQDVKNCGGSGVINDNSQIDDNIEYQVLTHSTLVVGWGETNFNGEMVKFWIVRNSYGGSWGESGYFKVRRGCNDFGGEGENSAHKPICWDCNGA